MSNLIAAMLALLGFFAAAFGASAQSLTFATVERPPFSIGTEAQTGFSIELMQRIAGQIGADIQFETAAQFGEMLARVETGEVDGAIANISITAAREEVMDFSLPIFESGLQIMVPEGRSATIWQQVFTLEIAAYIALAALVLFGGGMLMWVFERRAQPYFERPGKEAMFPAFWWALNLVVNGGFEERMPRSAMGRLLGTLMVISSLFLVSIFVARITAAMTVTALTSSVSGINDLDGRRVGTVAGSTAASFLDARDIRFESSDGFAELMLAFDAGTLDAVVFDGPLLKYHLRRNGDRDAYVLDRVFQAEDYGIVLPTGSALREPINQAILTLRENGTYDRIYEKWFEAQ